MSLLKKIKYFKILFYFNYFSFYFVNYLFNHAQTKLLMVISLLDVHVKKKKIFIYLFINLFKYLFIYLFYYIYLFI